MEKHTKRSLINRVWFKILLAFLLFIPLYTQKPYDYAETADVISTVLSRPLVTAFAWVLPLAKLLFLAAAVLPFLTHRGQDTARPVLGYYAFILLVVGLFQNMGVTDDNGFVWIVGNTLVILIVAVFCLIDLIGGKTRIYHENLNRGRLWVILPMALAFLMPYAINPEGQIRPSFTAVVLTNEAGVTYCMITPVILGVLLLFQKEVHLPTISVISFVGFLFGLLNMAIWFGMQPESWWMGVLHLPLVVLSFFGLVQSRKTGHSE